MMLKKYKKEKGQSFCSMEMNCLFFYLAKIKF